MYNLQDLQDMVDDLNNRADSDGISVPIPPKNKGRFTCICRVQADGRSEKNCTNNDKKFAYGYGEGPTIKIAKCEAGCGKNGETNTWGYINTSPTM